MDEIENNRLLRDISFLGIGIIIGGAIGYIALG